jgi:hypothetical protein
MTRKRPKSHVTEGEAYNILCDKLPHEWISRPLPPPDYGIDYEVEIVEEGLVTGHRLIIQVRGSDHIDSSDDYISYSIKVDLLEYYMNNDIPVILARVDTQRKEVYWLFIQEYVYETLNKSVPNWKKQESVTLHIPRNNSLPETSDKLRTIAEQGIPYLVSKSLQSMAVIIGKIEKQSLPGGSIILLIMARSRDMDRKQYIIDIGLEQKKNRISLLMAEDQSLIFQLYDKSGIEKRIMSHVNQAKWTLDEWHVVICDWSKNPGFMRLYVDTHPEASYETSIIEIEDIPDHPSVLIGTDITKTLFAEMTLQRLTILRNTLPDSYIKELTLNNFENAMQTISEIYF